MIIAAVSAALSPVFTLPEFVLSVVSFEVSPAAASFSKVAFTSTSLLGITKVVDAAFLSASVILPLTTSQALNT